MTEHEAEIEADYAVLVAEFQSFVDKHSVDWGGASEGLDPIHVLAAQRLFVAAAAFTAMALPPSLFQSVVQAGGNCGQTLNQFINRASAAFVPDPDCAS